MCPLSVQPFSCMLDSAVSLASTSESRPSGSNCLMPSALVRLSGRFPKRQQLWKGVHYVVLRSDVLILWIHCWGVKYGGGRDGRDPQFMDSAFEWDRNAHDPRVDETYWSSILTDQIRHRDSQRGEMDHDTPRANLNNEESDRSGEQGDGRSVWIDGTGCCTRYPGAEDVTAECV